MSFSRRKVLFADFLVALASGIVFQYLLHLPVGWAFGLGMAGLPLMLLATFLPQYVLTKFRHGFEVGLFLFLAGVGMFAVWLHSEKVHFVSDGKPNAYVAVVEEIPVPKAKSVACPLRLEGVKGIRTMVYFQKDDRALGLLPGDRIFLYTTLRSFRNRGNPDDFDYERYMWQLGYAATAYVSARNWQKTGSAEVGIYEQMQRLRKKVLQFYASLGFTDSQLGVLSALTLGYKQQLTDDVQSAFRSSGTAHVLCVSGLHVGIIYLIVMNLLVFLPKGVQSNLAKQLIIIFLLWMYACLTGFSPAVVRAAVMLTMCCVSVILTRKTVAYNVICVAAFMMLLFRPMDLFSIGFQLSFAAVFSMIYFLPYFQQVIPRFSVSYIGKRGNAWLRYPFECFFVSIAVQLGTAPLCLYYFGTFPLYFFMANLLVIPLATACIAVVVAMFPVVYLGSKVLIFGAVSDAVVWTEKCLLDVLLASAQFFESLPYSLFNGLKLNLLEAFSLSAFILLLFAFWGRRKPLYLCGSLAMLTIFLLAGVSLHRAEKESLWVFNRSDSFELGYAYGNNFVLTEADTFAVCFPAIPQGKMAVVRKNVGIRTRSEARLAVDYLVLSGSDSLSLYRLANVFCPQYVLLDGTLSASASRRLVRECKKMSIACYDLKETGAFRVNY